MGREVGFIAAKGEFTDFRVTAQHPKTSTQWLLVRYRRMRLSLETVTKKRDLFPILQKRKMRSVTQFWDCADLYILMLQFGF